MKNKDLVQSFNNAVNGILHAIKAERNMKVHIVVASIILLLSLIFNISYVEFLAVCISISLVIICELINTAVEVLVDIIVDVYHPKAKIIKDVAAGAVLVSAFSSVLVGYFVFFGKVCSVFEYGLRAAKCSSSTVTAIALVITAIIVLVIKAFMGGGTPFRGGMPSGHTALAFSAATAIAWCTDNVRITILGLSLAILVMQSRLEGKIHSAFEAVAGAILGTLVTIALFKFF